jgi:hypothetical protein
MTIKTFKITQRRIRIRLPPCYALDRWERDLPMGEIIQRDHRKWLLDVTRTELDDIKDDANHYANEGMDEVSSKLVASAKAALKRIEQAERAAKKT